MSVPEVAEAPPAKSGFIHTLRAGYGDTDQSGIVHHAVYLRWLEDARVAFFRERGMVFADIEEHERVGMAVVKATQRFLRPARFDQLVEIELWIGKIGRAQFEVEYRVWHKDTQLMAATLSLATISLDELRAIRIPESIAKHL